MSKELLC